MPVPRSCKRALYYSGMTHEHRDMQDNQAMNGSGIDVLRSGTLSPRRVILVVRRLGDVGVPSVKNSHTDGRRLT